MLRRKVNELPSPHDPAHYDSHPEGAPSSSDAANPDNASIGRSVWFDIDPPNGNPPQNPGLNNDAGTGGGGGGSSSSSSSDSSSNFSVDSGYSDTPIPDPMTTGKSKKKRLTHSRLSKVLLRHAKVAEHRTL